MTSDTAKLLNTDLIFHITCAGINQRAYTSDFNKHNLLAGVHTFIEDYTSQLAVWETKEKPTTIEEFNAAVEASNPLMTEMRKQLIRGQVIVYDEDNLKDAFVAPFMKRHYYFDPSMGDDMRYCQQAYRIPHQNTTICVFKYGDDFGCMITDDIPLENSDADKFMCLPAYTYDSEGRQENVTDWAQNFFREHYEDDSITKWDIIHYMYGVFHHEDYLKQAKWEGELPRVPLAQQFWKMRGYGARLAKLHKGYERAQRYKLKWKQTAEGLETISFRVIKMKLEQPHSKRKKKTTSDPSRTAFYRKKAAETKSKIARELWHPQTPAASLMWEALRDHRLDGLEFKRVATRKTPAVFNGFYCPSAGLRVEITGMYGEQGRSDSADGVVFYITNNDVFNRMEEMLIQILSIIDEQIPNRITDTQLAKVVTTQDILDDENQRDYPTYYAVKINNTLTLENIPEEAFDYRISGRSALEWMVDHYVISEDPISGREFDPNAYGGIDAQYIIKLFERVLYVSVESAKILEEVNKQALS